ncbi:Alpha beta hydrolase fold family [Colletotrichum higginsianum IMI 349063]|uniref:Alpha beta hydrolase fold family n=2 Tax=Colletotrichum higginsianum (strain IMI 349063) TaxID=759273 RepID=A0A1B7YSB4_COLHI|nr:Alpha beta hydrolase fold family [Colletotrichum higginsianum IMI 349063]OBR14913.1 Alpha beta hydrolase fold family [Colletotrichum higginsianum IMI 349063]
MYEVVEKMNSEKKTPGFLGPKEIETSGGPKAKGRAAVTAAALSLLALTALIRGNFLSAPPWSSSRHNEHHSGVPGQGSSTEWSWSSIKPSRALKWHSCFEDGGYDCARLDVPMDWQQPRDDRRVVLAIVRIRATDASDYRGPVIFNPGGPGGSGVWSMRNHGRMLHEIVGTNHDLISFDPRGVGASIPRLECWSSPQQGQSWELQDPGILDSHEGILGELFTRAAAYSQACERAMRPSGILEHIGTASAARDMLEIVHQTGNDKLRYWGFSYGTILGGVFAAMYPDKVDRLVSDGNVDYREWFNYAHVNFVRDTDKVLFAFYDFCHRAGPERCAFHAPTPEAVMQRFGELLSGLKAHPVIVPATDDDDDDNGPEVPLLVTYSKVMRLLSSTLYQPQDKFESFSRIIAALEQRDGRPFYEYYHPRGKPGPAPVCSTQPISPLEPLPGIIEGTEDAFPVIMCADHPAVLNLTLEEVQREAETLMELSPATGALAVPYQMTCNQRTTRPRWRFDGPFEGKTDHPILFIANRADNITPLLSARNNSAGFPGSAVLVQNSYGHTSLAAPSKCTRQYINAYFQNGTLPPAGTECEGDSQPFGPKVGPEARVYHNPLYL